MNSMNAQLRRDLANCLDLIDTIKSEKPCEEAAAKQRVFNALTSVVPEAHADYVVPVTAALCAAWDPAASFEVLKDRAWMAVWHDWDSAHGPHWAWC
jgi:hypothetical protein